MIQLRNQRMRQIGRNKRHKLYKKLITQVNAGLILFSASSVLGNPVGQPRTVKAQDSLKKVSPLEFINNIKQSAEKIAAENNLYASVMIAQAALESAWGNSRLAQAPNYNLFGIKGNYKGQSTNMDTLEDDGTGNYYQIKDDFRRYNSYAESLNDYADLLTGKGSQWRREFYAGALRSNTNSYHDATAHLTGRYATDTSYGSKLNKIISEYNLDAYDVAGPASRASRNSQNNSTADLSRTPKQSGQTSTASANYQVKPGDSIYRIARQFGIKPQDLMAANNLQISSVIHPNQRLTIPGVTSSSVESSRIQVTEARISKQVITPPATSAASQTGQGQGAGSAKYTVKSGDSLYAIAAKQGCSIQALLQANGLSLSSVIHPNQQLVIPGGTSNGSNSNPVQTDNSAGTRKVVEKTVVAETTQPAGQAAGQGSRYTVKPGDSLYAIARKTGTGIQTLLAANGLSMNSVIHPGQVLSVSGQAQEAPSTVNTYVVNEPTNQVVKDYKEANQDVPVKVGQTEYIQAESVTTNQGTYTCKQGDTLWGIANRYGMSLETLVAKNHGISAIYPGTVLYV